MIMFKIGIIAFSCVFAGIGIYAVTRNMAIECIGELKYMKREAEKRKETRNVCAGHGTGSGRYAADVTLHISAVGIQCKKRADQFWSARLFGVNGNTARTLRLHRP